MNNTITESKSKLSTKVLVYCALLIALSFIGAQIKIFGSIAFDSLPAFLGALLLGPIAGAVIGILGHFLTAITSGFPQTVPIHIIIAIGMGGICYSFGFLKDRINIILNSFIVIILNGIVLSLIATVALFMMGVYPEIMGTWYFLTTLLVPVSAANVVIAVMIYKAIGEKIKL